MSRLLKFLYLLLLIPAYVYAQQCLMVVPPQGAVDLGAPDHIILANVEVYWPDGGGQDAQLPDGNLIMRPLEVYGLKVDPMWSKTERDNRLAEKCADFHEERKRASKATTLLTALDAGYSILVDAGQ